MIRNANRRVGCKPKMTINLDRNSRNWIVRSFIEEYNGHPLTTPNKVMKHYSHQTLHQALPTMKLIDKFDDKGVCFTTIYKAINIIYENKEESFTPNNGKLIFGKNKRTILERSVSL